MAKIKVNADKFTQITLTTEGIDNVTVVSDSGNASIAGDTLYLDFPTVSGVDTSTFITSASINSGSVTVENNTLLIDIPTVEAVDTDTTVSNVSIVGGNAFASIDGGTLYLLTADSTPKSSANFSITSSANIDYWHDATIKSSHLGDGVVSNFALPTNCAIDTLNADTFVISGSGSGTADFILSETQQYYSAIQRCNVQQIAGNKILDMPLATDFSNAGSANVSTSGGYAFDDNCLKVTTGNVGSWTFALDNIGGTIKPFAFEIEVYRVSGALILTSEPFGIANTYFSNNSTDSRINFADTALNTWLKYKFIFDGVDNCKFYINDQLFGTVQGAITQPINQLQFATSNYYRNLKYIEAV